MRTSRLLWPAIGLVLALAASWEAGLVGRSAWPLGAAKDAGVDAREEPLAHAAPSRVIAEGRLAAYPGAHIVVGTEVGGTIVQLSVDEKSSVRKGDLIAELRCDDLRASRAEADARIAEAEADRQWYERETRRSEHLLGKNAGSSTELDGNRRGLAASLARRRAAAAARDRFDALLAKARITSPIDGIVLVRHAHPGETVAAYAPLVTIADLARVRVEAEIDESDIARIRLGSPATITAEGFGLASWRGRVEEIPDAVAARRLRPEDPARPVDMRVLLVKIALQEPTPLKLGQRVDVEIRIEP